METLILNKNYKEISSLYLIQIIYAITIVLIIILSMIVQLDYISIVFISFTISIMHKLRDSNLFSGKFPGRLMVSLGFINTLFGVILLVTGNISISVIIGLGVSILMFLLGIFISEGKSEPQ